jgi:hypothetical protein
MTSTTMAIQIRFTSPAVAWNKSQSTKRTTATTMSKWINFVDLRSLLQAPPR